MSASALICPFTPRTWGHLVRCVAVARELAALGHRVAFAAPGDTRAQIAAAGFRHVELVAMADQSALRPPTKPVEATAARRTIAADLDAVRRCLRAEAPDVVVTDLLPLANIAAALEMIPSVAILNLELVAQPLAWWLPGLERVCDELGVPRWAASRVFGDALVVADSAASIGLRDLPAEHAARIAASVAELAFVGPLLDRLPARRPRTRERPLVIISLGGSRDTRAVDVLDGAASVAADFRVITAHPVPELARAADAIRARGGTVEIVDFVADFPEQLAAADALVTHGGHGTLVLALALAVPTLVAPNTAEREINASRLRWLGDVLPPDPAQVRATIGARLAALLGDRSRDRARAAYAATLERDGAARAAQIIARVAGSRLHAGEAGVGAVHDLEREAEQPR